MAAAAVCAGWAMFVRGQLWIKIKRYASRTRFGILFATDLVRRRALSGADGGGKRGAA